MDIIQYITEQLYSKQEVVISGFGKFVGERKSAVVDKEKQKIHPPSKSVTFIRDTKSFALDLAIFVARKEFITEDDAAKAINKFVAEANKKLENGQPVVFEGIGVITVSPEGKTSFKQSQKANLLPETFAMEAVEVGTNKTGKTAKRGPVKKAKQSTTTTNDDNSSNSWIWWLTGAVALIIILFGVWWLFLRKAPDKVAKNNKKVVKTEKTVEKKTVVDSAKLAAQEMQAVKPPSENATKEPSIQETFATHFQNKSVIYLVVGSFKNKAKADEYVTQLRDEGYESEIIQGENGYLRVTIGKFPNAEKAMVVYEKFTTKYPDSDIWAL